MRDQIVVMYGTGMTDPIDQPFQPQTPISAPWISSTPLPASPSEAIAIAIRCGKAEAELAAEKAETERLRARVAELEAQLEQIREAAK